MQKKAQQRSLLNQLREKINIPGSYLEGFFKPELDRVMSSLKQLDDRIRSELAGKKIGTAAEPENPIAAKDLLKSARTNFNRREYMAGVADLGLFHKKMYDIVRDVDKFYVDVNQIHNKFLFEGLDEGQQQKMKQLREHMSRKAALTIESYFIKEAGIMDFFYNIGTKRGRSLMAWEKKYPKQTKELREGGLRLIDAADDLLAKTLSNLKQMATARAIRRPDDYLDVANKIKLDFTRFDMGDKGFRSYYNNVITPFLKIQDEISTKQPTETSEEVSKMEPKTETIVQGPVKTPAQTLKPMQEVAPPLGQNPPGASAPFALPEEKSKETIPQPPITEKKLPEDSPVVERPTVEELSRKSHHSFIHLLEALSNEDPKILVSCISKYAASIQEEDMETAIKLFSLIKQTK